jgi:hypothetical protein
MLIIALTLPACAAGGLKDAPWPMLLAINAAFLLPPFFVGLGLSLKLKLRPMALLTASLWLMAWHWMAYEKGLAGALERATAFISIMVFLSSPLIVGWMVGRFWHRARPVYTSAATHGK